MYNRVICFLEKFSILCNNQFGFRSKHSTTQALLHLTDKIQRSIDKGLYCIVAVYYHRVQSLDQNKNRAGVLQAPARLKSSRGIGVLSKLRNYVKKNILKQLYYSLIYPCLTYGLLLRGNAYSLSIKPLIILQKRAMRTITFSKPDEHSEPLFKEPEILKLCDLVTLHNAHFVYQYHNNLIPSSFNNFFQSVVTKVDNC